MNELSLFTGAGGGVLGSKILGWKTIGYVEYEKYCQEVIKQRIADGILDAAPIFGDIRKFISEGYADAYQGMVDVVTGGFPCQDISIAGKGIGIEGENSGRWEEMVEVISRVRPAFAFVENSPMLTIRGGTRVVADITRLGYDARWGIVGNYELGFCTRSERFWLFAYAPNGYGLEKVGIQSKIADKKQSRRRQFERAISACLPFETIPAECRNIDGLARGMDRLKAIGNGQVPLCMAYAFSILSQGIVE